MRIKSCWPVLSACLALSAVSLSSSAAMPEEFAVRNTQDLVDICDTDRNDPLHAQVLSFCYGYVAGAYQYQQNLYQGPGRQPLVCPPNPPPPRKQGVALYLQWMKSHPEYLPEQAVDTIMKFLVETWPCQH